MPEKTIGFIGLGNMGAPMASNLSKNSHPLICYDTIDTKKKSPSNAIVADSIEQVAKSASIVFLCLPNGSVVLDVVDRILSVHDRCVEIVVDNTTAGVSEAKEAWERLNKENIKYADAPVSGGVSGAKAGTLAMMVAASQELYTEIEPLLFSMAKNARNVGDQPGQGMAMKLLNNFLSGMAMAASSEAVAFGVAQGLKPEKVIEMVNLSTGRNTTTEDKFPKRILTETFDSGFATNLMAKDLKLYVKSAKDSHAPSFLSEILLNGVWSKMLDKWPDSDFTKIYPFIKKYGK